MLTVEVSSCLSMHLPGLEPFSWAGWYPIVMATGPPLPNVPHPFGSGAIFYLGILKVALLRSLAS